MMRCETLIPAIVGMVLASGLPVRAQSVSELLEKGIFTEETVGDLDAAIKIYEQIVAEAVKNRSYAAQAQYRVGMCYLKKGKKDEAVAALQKLVADFPKQKELVAQAHTRLSALGYPISAVSGRARYRLLLDDALANLLAGRPGHHGGDYDFSPDGERIVFLAPWELEQVSTTAHGQGSRNGTGWVGLYVSDRSGAVIRPLVDIERPMKWLASPTWSPDGRLIAFRAKIGPSHEKTRDFVPALFVVGPDGGAPRQIGPAPLPGEGRARGVSWTPDSRHLTYARADGFYTMDLDGKIVRFIDRKNSKFTNLGGYSPNGRWLAFSEPNKDDGMDVWLVGSTGGGAVRVTDGTAYAGDPTWAPDGRAIYFVSSHSRRSPDANVWRVELDPQSGATSGKIEQVTYYSDARIGYPTAIAGGDALAFVLSKKNHVIHVADASRPEAARAVARGESPRLSPDGQTLYYIGEGPGQTGIFAVNRQGGSPRRLTSARPLEDEFGLSSDGRTIAYAALMDGKAAFFTVSVHGGEPRLLASSDSRSGATPRWSPDGERLAYAHDDGLYVIPATGGQTPSRIAQLAKWEPWSLRWSPDGEYVAAFGYGESEEKENSIFVVPASGGEPRRLTPYDDIYKEGLEWHPDGQRITYHLSLSYSKTYQAFLDGRPPSLFLNHPDSWDYIGLWTADGRRFFFSGSAGGEWKTFVYDTESGDVRLFRERSGLPVWSRDGKTIAWSSETTTRQLWVMEDFLPEPKVAAASGTVTRQVWAPALDDMGVVSPDGRYMSYVNWDKGNLAVHDFTTGENRDLTVEGTWKKPNQFCDVSIWSPDSRQIAYYWINLDTGSHLRIVGLDGSEPRTLASGNEKLGRGVPTAPWPRAWSQDGKYILAYRGVKDDTLEQGYEGQIVLVTVADGSLRVLKSLGERHTENMSLSPDGRYVVFELDAADGSKKRDIHLLATDGSGELPLVEHPADDKAPQWTPDGKRIVFLSDRSGSTGLWMLDMADGKPKGTPALLKDVGQNFRPKGLARDGSLYYAVAKPYADVYVAALDFDTAQVLTSPSKVSLRFEGKNHAPVWSPDGRYLAYATRRGQLTFDLVIRSVQTGQERNLTPKPLDMGDANGSGVPQWSRDGRSILVTGNGKGGRGFYLVDVQTGDFTTVVQDERGAADSRSGRHWPVFSTDGTQIYYMREDGSDQLIMAMSLESHGERELYRTNNYIARLACSPDGQRLAFFESTQDERPAVLKTIPASGGEPTDLFTLQKGQLLFWGVGISWTPDGRYVVVGGRPEAGDDTDELWGIPATGGEPHKINLGIKVRQMSLHPDGARIALASREPGGGGEIWVMENFLPELTSSR